MSRPRSFSASRACAYYLAPLLVASLVGDGLASEHAGGDWKFRAMGACQDCTITGRDLTGRSLFSIDMERASISDTTFQKATLFVANFQESSLTRVQFDRADLKGAEFNGATLRNVTFVDADLTGATFDGATLTGTDLDAAILCFTKMPNGDTNNSDCR